jgi:hypothetical protein
VIAIYNYEPRCNEGNYGLAGRAPKTSPLQRDEVLTQRQETMPRPLLARRMTRCSSPDRGWIARAAIMGHGQHEDSVDAIGCQTWLLLALDLEDVAFGSGMDMARPTQ